MSEVKIQSTPAVPEGAQADVLTAENEQRSRSGFSGNQNTLSFSRGTEVNFGNAQNPPIKPNAKDGASARDSANVSGMSVGGRAVSVKPVDHIALEGSNRGDHRAVAAPAAMPPNPAPRQPVGQAKLNGKLDKIDAAASVSFPPNSNNAGA